MTNSRSSIFTYLVAIALLGAVVGFYFYLINKMEQSLVDAVVHSSESANEDVTQLFINDVYDALQRDIQLSSDLSQQPDELSGERYDRIDERIRQFMLGTKILKVKIYNLKGTTIYSSDPSQIGSDYSENIGFINSSQGHPYSVSSIRSEFKGYSGVVYDRDVVSSYVPIRQIGLLSGPRSGRVIGIAEIYVDRTEQMNGARQTVGEIKLVVAIALFLILAIVLTAGWLYAVNLAERFISEAQEEL